MVYSLLYFSIKTYICSVLVGHWPVIHNEPVSCVMLRYGYYIKWFYILLFHCAKTSQVNVIGHTTFYYVAEREFVFCCSSVWTGRKLNRIGMCQPHDVLLRGCSENVHHCQRRWHIILHTFSPLIQCGQKQVYWSSWKERLKLRGYCDETWMHAHVFGLWAWASHSEIVRHGLGTSPLPIRDLKMH